MNNPNLVVLGALLRDPGGVAIVRYADLGERDWMVRDVASLFPSQEAPLVVGDVEEALGHHDRTVFLVPPDEREAVLDLDACRDRINNPETPRTRPLVLFLLRESTGEETLASTSHSLAGLTRGNAVDPEQLAEIDVEEERTQFLGETGLTPEDWLVQWRQGTLPSSLTNIKLSYRALLLERA